MTNCLLQELEKFKFVLDYKIKELKKQIEPKEEQITDMKDQVKVRSVAVMRWGRLFAPRSCSAVLCCVLSSVSAALFCCAVQCHAMLCCAELSLCSFCCTLSPVPSWAMLCCAVLSTVAAPLCGAVLCCAVLCSAAM